MNRRGDCASGAAAAGPWQAGWAWATGSHHAAVGGPCEDTLGLRFGARGSVAVAVGDGVSGGACGHEASHAAVSHCLALASTTQTPLAAHLAGLDATVASAVARHSQSPGATTLCAAWLAGDGRGWLSHVGDVRAYLWTVADSGLPQLDPLTRDHSYALLGLLPPPGVPADNPAWMLGNGSAPAPQPRALRLWPGQLLLLCSDGLHGSVSERALASALPQTPVPSPAALAACARRLLCQALRAGATDDLSAMLLCHRGNSHDGHAYEYRQTPAVAADADSSRGFGATNSEEPAPP